MKSSVMAAVLPLYFAVCVLSGEHSSNDSFGSNGPGYQANLKLAAFNVQTFGVKKMATFGVPEILVRIILRYDVILIQEIRDSSGKAIVDLLSMVNREESVQKDCWRRTGNERPWTRNSKRGQYDITVSPRLGRSSSKEQYAIFYRKDALSVKATYVYDDGDERINNDTFEREPYIVHLKSQFTGITDFVLVAIHTSPSKAPQEIDELTHVYDDVVRRLNIEDVVILGDLNAACRYMSDSDWRQVSLANDKRFHWLVSDCVDTTVSGGLCAYDRFVAAGEAMLKAVILPSAGRFEYDREYSINRTMTSMVSDHFPIEMQLFSRVLASAKNVTRTSVEYTFKLSQPMSLTEGRILTFQRKKLLQREGFSVVVTYSADHAIAGVTFAKDFKNWNEALNGITVVQTKCVHNQLITHDQAEMAVFQITGAWAEKMKAHVDKTGVVKLVCEMKPSPCCWISLLLD